ncbi:Threonine synthase [Pseudomonas orientalis]|nr:Threonine synthase [Pseudomonas orientalis]
MKIPCGRGLAPDGGVSVTDQLTDILLSGASPLPHFDL